MISCLSPNDSLASIIAVVLFANIVYFLTIRMTERYVVEHEMRQSAPFYCFCSFNDIFGRIYGGILWKYG